MPRPLRIPSTPHYLAVMRAGLGLTQAQLAGALGVSRQFVTQVEAGQRVLPPEAGAWLGWLGLALRPATTPGPEEPSAAAELPASALPSPGSGPLQARAAAIAYETLLLSRRLARGQARARRATAWLAAAPRLLAALPPQAQPQRLWLAATTAEAEAALEGEGRPALHQLWAARLVGLRAEAAALAATLPG